MMRLGVNICGLSEVRWDGQGHFTTLDGHTIVYAGRPTHGMSRIAVWIHRKVAGALVRYEPISDRLMVVRLNAKPRNITLIQTYGPTTWANNVRPTHITNQRITNGVEKGSTVIYRTKEVIQDCTSKTC